MLGLLRRGGDFFSLPVLSMPALEAAALRRRPPSIASAAAAESLGGEGAPLDSSAAAAAIPLLLLRQQHGHVDEPLGDPQVQYLQAACLHGAGRNEKRRAIAAGSRLPFWPLSPPFLFSEARGQLKTKGERLRRSSERERAGDKTAFLTVLLHAIQQST